ncbi:EAL domain-containing protein [Alkalimonas sp.]|uniref:putative bifunctional diguanylate cyclase/phosphodiesterase n=1 Tax=Alkalimonas sp. TaxID=1872453 RepID=UPI00263AC560|nr:EAL domain-containing protein [Alkalimonas sp.]MCC5825330.1 EAL domain-containing protein [Alkalimonas sp.]
MQPITRLFQLLDARLLLTLLVFFLFVISFLLYVNAGRGIERAHNQRLQSFLLADELRQSSDDLTRMVRTYAVTGDERFRRYFDEILAIRNGDLPRPVDYHHIYWDLVDESDNRPRPAGKSVALLELMRQAGFTEHELSQLVSAKEASDALVNLEQKAMSLVETGDDTLREEALSMLHGSAYHEAKAGIMQPIDQLYSQMRQRTDAAVAKSERQARLLLMLFLVLGVMLLWLLWRFKKREAAVLGASVGELYRRIEQLGQGNFTEPAPMTDQQVNTVSGWLSQTQHRLAQLEQNRRQAQKRLQQLAHYDPLTGLPNRFLFAEKLQQAMQHALDKKHLIALAFIDLDGFKAVNDQFGHPYGDQVLLALSRRLQYRLSESNCVARISGDEFVLLLPDLNQLQDCDAVLQDVLSALAYPVQVNSIATQLSASIGVSFYPQEPSVEPEQLIRQADQAMYLAKQSGKNRIHYFDIAADQHMRTMHQRLKAIDDGLQHNQFVLFYQPKVDFVTGQCIGVEALIRWQHPDQGLLPPSDFLPLIEQHTLGIKLGQWVLHQAFFQLSDWQAQGVELPISVNIAANHLQAADFVDQLETLAMNYPDISFTLLELEIVETSALQDFEHASQTMIACSKLGVSFSLDDFGTGYSSLSYLKRLPISTLKLDQSFVRDILTDSEDLAILQGVGLLAASFQLKTIAEGVESSAHIEKLLEIGYRYGQGYGIARPMPIERLTEWLANNQQT